MLSIYRMSKKSNKTFRLAFLRKRINDTFRSEALRAALLAELNGGEDAALVVQMVERVKPVVNPPTQAVAPIPKQATPQPLPVPRQPPPPVTDGNTAASAVDALDSEDELVQEMLLTPVRERRLREQLQSWRSSSSD